MVAEASETNNNACSAAVQIGLPDLAGSSVTPAVFTASPGGPLGIVDTVANAGTVAAASFVIGFRLSTNPIVGDADDIPLAESRTVTALDPLASSTTGTTLTVPPTTPLGAYVVCAVPDVANVVPETAETNNAVCSTSAVQVGLPDLTETDVSTAAPSAAPGTLITILETVTNLGSIPAGSFSIGFRLSANTIVGDEDDIVLAEARIVTSLDPSANQAGGTDVTVPATTVPGVYFVCAVADTGSAMVETNEANNGACSAATVVVTGE
jgi:subtilase family serine protease